MLKNNILSSFHKLLILILSLCLLQPFNGYAKESVSSQYVSSSNQSNGQWQTLEYEEMNGLEDFRDFIQLRDSEEEVQRIFLKNEAGVLGNIISQEDLLKIAESDLPNSIEDKKKFEAAPWNLNHSEWSIAPSPEIEKSFKEYSASDQKNFHEKRKMFLNYTAKGLKQVSWIIGIGSVIGESVSFVAKKSTQIMGFKKDQNTQNNPTSNPNKSKENLNLEDQKKATIYRLLKLLNLQIWNQFPLVMRSDEFGFQVSLGLAFLGEFNKKKFGGLFDIGLNIAFNQREKALIFQIYYNGEKYESTLMKAVFTGGLIFKMGPSIINTAHSENNFSGLRTIRGSSFYPPGVPLFQNTTPESYSAGLSSGLTIPPSPFGDMMTYSTSSVKTVLMKVKVSPLLKGFINVQFAEIPDQFKSSSKNSKTLSPTLNMFLINVKTYLNRFLPIFKKNQLPPLFGSQSEEAKIRTTSNNSEGTRGFEDKESLGERVLSPFCRILLFN